MNEVEAAHCRVWKFNTFFNIFPLNHYRLHMSTPAIGLVLAGHGSGLLRVYGLSCDGEEVCIASEYIDFANGDYLRDGFSCDLPYEYLFVEIQEQGETCVLLSGAWVTRSLPVQIPRIAIVICTYKREEQLAHNLRILSEYFTKGTGTAPSCYDVIVVDNGQSVSRLDIMPSGDGSQGNRFRLISNDENTGGSGGFGRGMREAGACADYSHVLLMDDDIYFDPEMLVRLAACLSYARCAEKYALGGVMLDKDDPPCIVEWGARYPAHPVGIRRGERLERLDMLLPPQEEADYCAWTFFCYPLTVETRGELPLDFFVRADDAEFGLRLKTRWGIATHTRQGLAVWHHAFTENNPTVTFYTIRNELIVNKLYGMLTLWVLLRYAAVPVWFLMHGKVQHAKAALCGIWASVRWEQ